MSIPDSVSKLTPTEIIQLNSWSFINSYKKYHRELLQLANVEYTVVLKVLNNQHPTKEEFCRLYGETLKITNLYVKQIAGKKAYLPTSLYDYFANLLAKYIVEENWAAISNVSTTSELQATPGDRAVLQVGEEIVTFDKNQSDIIKASGTTSTQEAEKGISEARRNELEQSFLARRKYTWKDFIYDLYQSVIDILIPSLIYYFPVIALLIVSYLFPKIISIPKTLAELLSSLVPGILFISLSSFIMIIAIRLFNDARGFIKTIKDKDIVVDPIMIIFRITTIFIIYLLYVLVILGLTENVLSHYSQTPSIIITVLNVIQLVSIIGFFAGYIADISYSLYQRRIQEKKNSVRMIQKALNELSEGHL